MCELYYEVERYEPPPELRPALKNVPQRYVGRGAAVKRLDHVNVLARDVAANRRFAQEQLGFRLYEQIINDDGSEQGAWMSLTIAAHELIYVADHAGASGRLHHLAFFVDTREEVPARGGPVPRRRRADRGRAVKARGRPGHVPVRV